MARRYTGCTVRKFGWKRVAKNFARLGWSCTDADEVTTKYTDVTRTTIRIDGKDYVNIEAKETSKTRVDLSFVRDSSWYSNLPSIFIFEALFMIIFNVRRLIGFFLPFVSVIAMLIVPILGGFLSPDLQLGTIVFWEVILVIWVIFMILESIIASIAGKILKPKK